MRRKNLQDNATVFNPRGVAAKLLKLSVENRKLYISYQQKRLTEPKICYPLGVGYCFTIFTIYVILSGT